MNAAYRYVVCFLLLLMWGGAAACRQLPPAESPDSVPTPTVVVVVPTEMPASSTTDTRSFITVALDAPYPPFVDIDAFGNVIGFDADVITNLAAEAGLDVEFVVTSHDGLLESVAKGEFDAGISGLIIPPANNVTPGISYTIPYLEVGQVLVVRADERALQSYNDIQLGTRIGVAAYSNGEVTARTVPSIAQADLLIYQTSAQALQALVDGNVDGVILDSDDAEHYTTLHFQQLQITGGEGGSAWISSVAYGITLAEANTPLLTQLNNTIQQLYSDGTIDRLTRAWLIPDDEIEAGESLIGTPANELVIGISGELSDLDPAAVTPSLISWELKMNTMAGLYRITSDNQLEPLLFTDLSLSEDATEYTYRLKEGLVFPDGTPLTAEDFRWSVLRAAGQGNWLVNAFLKDANGDGFADDDSVTVVDSLSIRFTLEEPTSYFLTLLANPPYFPVSQDCFAYTYDPTNTCGGLGPYTIQEWVAGEKLELKANPQWPGPAPAFENIQIRFYDTPAQMRDSLSRGSIDLAWSGLTRTDILELQGNDNYQLWDGAAAFKSSLVFVHTTPPWDNAGIRQAAALAVDREALAQNVFGGTRLPLYSPIPTGLPGAVASFPQRNLDQARSLLAQAGYSATNPLPIQLAYVNDGRYSDVEEQYATLLKEQLEETGVFVVTLEGSPWEVFRTQKATCNYPAFLQGWPAPDQPVPYLDAMSWLYFYIENTNTLCSNYISSEMDALIKGLNEAPPNQPEAQDVIYGQMQAVWAAQVPTLPLTQSPRFVVALPGVQNVQVNGLGLLHYEALTKGGGG